MKLKDLEPAMGEEGGGIFLMRTPHLSERRSQGGSTSWQGGVQETKVRDRVRLLTNAKGKERKKLITREAS